MNEAAAAAAPESPFRLLVRRLWRHGAARSSLIVLMLMALAVVLVPLLSPYPYDRQDLDLIGQPTAPDAQHWFGTDELGQDSLTRLFYGGRISLAVGLASALVATVVGTAVGALAGFFGGFIEALLMRLTRRGAVGAAAAFGAPALRDFQAQPAAAGGHHRGAHLDGNRPGGTRAIPDAS